MSLETLSAGLADAVEAVRPSLLGLRGRKRSGTALAVSPSHAITAGHLVRSKDGTVLLPDGASAEARVVATARALDLVLLEVEATLTPVTWAEGARVGHLVVPVAYGPRATLGMIAQLAGPWRTPAGASIDQWIEVDGSLPAGFSGGPLLDGSGGVLGMNTHRFVRGGTTLPAATLREAITHLESHGTLEPGFLGVGGTTATLTPDQAAEAGQSEALLVVAIEPDSPASGILTVGDIVLRVDGEAVTGVRSLRAALSGIGAGETAKLDVLVGSAVETREVTLTTRPHGLD